MYRLSRYQNGAMGCSAGGGSRRRVAAGLAETGCQRLAALVQEALQLAHVSVQRSHRPRQRWLREPQRVNPDSAMPDLGVSERDARDMAAYLYTLDRVQ